MSRARLRKALTSRDPADPAVVPLIEAHAARLEQIPAERWRVDAEAQARMLRSTQALYGLDAVTIGGGGRLDAKTAALAADVVRRLRPVLGERAGIAVVLPGAAPSEALTEMMQTIGGEEPDLFLLHGEVAEVDATLEGLAEFYGATLVALGPAAPAGVVALSPSHFTTIAEPSKAWLYTTTGELDAAADPEAVRAAITRLRERHGA